MPAENPIPGAVSLVIAITGHRDLHPDDIPALQAKIQEILENLKQKHTPTPLLLCSGLAEGADRVAARAAQAASVPYVAVIPMPEHLYRGEFTGEASLVEFETLFKDAARRLVLPLAAGATLEQVADPGPARGLQHDRLGQFLVNNSQILIAVWDKRRNQKPGGASAVVAMKLGESRQSGRLADSRANSGGVVPSTRFWRAVSRTPPCRPATTTGSRLRAAQPKPTSKPSTNCSISTTPTSPASGSSSRPGPPKAGSSCLKAPTPPG
jgi:hypothetical protein